MQKPLGSLHVPTFSWHSLGGTKLQQLMLQLLQASGAKPPAQVGSFGTQFPVQHAELLPQKAPMGLPQLEQASADTLLHTLVF